MLLTRVFCLLAVWQSIANAESDDSIGIVSFSQLSRPRTHETGWWWRPVDRLSARAAFFHETSRPYSTSIRPRYIAGRFAQSCANREGAACDAGERLWGDVDTVAGYGELVTSFLRLSSGTLEQTGGFATRLERGYVRARLSFVEVEVGRDVLQLGPGDRYQVGWSENAAPLDQVRIATARPIVVSSDLRARVLYTVGRLRAPQTFAGTLVTIGRAQLDIGQRTEVGVTHLLQLGGEGALRLGPVDFIAEHLRRADKSGGLTDSSNRRFGGDVAVRFPELSAARLYYELIFEDIRQRRLLDAYRYDADHLLGLEVRFDGRHEFLVEWHKTGVRSQEHGQRISGFTNLGRTVGSALGPAAQSLFVADTMGLENVQVQGWLEAASLSSDRWAFLIDGPIDRTASGPDEERYRVGSRINAWLRHDLCVQVDVSFERIHDYSFMSGVSKNNGGVGTSLIWFPDLVLRASP
jgi:hypothetical protein